ncbi:MAG: RidA family protein [Clostridia bacterium]|nr:RidA family protein [Clostridia bacterium]
MMTKISTEKAPAAIGPYSQAIAHGGLVYTSGQIPASPSGGAIPAGIEAQARQAFDNLGALLEAAGSGLSLVLKTTLFIVNMADFAAVNAVYAEYFKEPYPARSCVAAAALPKGVQIEIEAVAATTEKNI